MAHRKSRDLQNLINGNWQAGQLGEQESLNPAHPGEIVARYRTSSEEDIREAVAMAQSAAARWESEGVLKRGLILRDVADLMQQRQEELAELMTSEQGKTLAESRVEVAGSIETIRYHAASSRSPLGKTYPSSFPGETIHTTRQALGVVAVITPWNFPTQIPAWKIAPALLWGNSVVWKPASDVPAVSHAFASVFHDAGVPAGVLNMVLASGSVAQSLVDSPVIAGITFTGSVAVGSLIARSAASRGIKTQLELGGHNAAIVMPDVDPEYVAAQLVVGAMSGTGQKCTATRRIITVGDIHDDFVAALRREIEMLVVGDGAEKNHDRPCDISCSKS